MTITTEQAVQMAREIECEEDTLFETIYEFTAKELTALCNAVRKQTLLEAAEYLETYAEPDSASYVLRRMAGE